MPSGYAARVTARVDRPRPRAGRRPAAHRRRAATLRSPALHLREGNFRIRQDENSSAASPIRPGSPLAAPGPEREVTIDRERGVCSSTAQRGLLRVRRAYHAGNEGTAAGPTDVTVRLSPVPRSRSARQGPWAHGDPDRRRRRDVPPRRPPQAWGRPVAFTAKRLRDEPRSLTKRYRERGYIRRAVSSAHIDKSVDRAAKNFPLTITINERKRSRSPSKAICKSRRARQGQLTMLDRGS